MFQLEKYIEHVVLKYPTLAIIIVIIESVINLNIMHREIRKYMKTAVFTLILMETNHCKDLKMLIQYKLS